MIRHTAAVLFLFLAACTVPQPVSVLSDIPADARLMSVLVGTTRATNAQGYPLDTGSGPLTYARLEVAEPPGRALGDVPIATGTPDPSKDFTVAGIDPLADRAAFVKALSRQLAARPRGQRGVMVFVHGYFTPFSTGLFRTVQIERDLQIRHLPVHFAWPSTLSPLGYGADLDTLLNARDPLEKFLGAISAAGAERIVIVAHSLGGALVTEVLRQISLSGQTALMRKIDGVFLVSPDIDVDRFQRLVARIKPLPDPFVVFSSKRDRILPIAARLHGTPYRLGNLEDPDALVIPGVTLVDVSGYPEGFTNHQVPFSAPGFLAMVHQKRNDPDMLGRALRVMVGG